MWLMLPTGFISMVQDRKDPSQIWVRARVKEDIENTFPGYKDKIITKIGADYIYRLLIPKEVAAVVMWNQVMDLDYDSHAKEVMNKRSHPNKERMTAYYACWTALAKMQPYAPYARTPRPVGGYVPKSGTSTWTPNQGWTPGRKDQVTTFQGGAPYDWSKHPQSKSFTGNTQDALDLGDDLDWPESKSVTDAIHGADVDEDLQTLGMSDEEFEQYIAVREQERRGPRQSNRRTRRAAARNRTRKQVQK